MKPTQKPDWQVSGIEPVSTRVSGWMPGDEPQAGEFNWLFYNLSDWVDHLDTGVAELSSSPTFTGTVTASGFIGDLTGSAVSFSGSLSGDVTGTQAATAIADTVVIGKTLTGYSSTTGSISSSDTILSAIGKLNGNTPLRSSSSPNDISSTASSGTATTVSRSDHTHRGISALSISGSPAMYGAVTISAGTGISVSQGAGNIQITSTVSGGGGGGVTDLTPAYIYTDVAINSEVTAREAGDAAAKNYADTVSTPKNISLTGTSIDWLTGDVFYQNIFTNTSYTFSNETNGKTIVLIIKNVSASDVTLTLPTVVKSGVLNVTVAAGKENIYTFVRSNSKTYATVIADMV